MATWVDKEWGAAAGNREVEVGTDSVASMPVAPWALALLALVVKQEVLEVALLRHSPSCPSLSQRRSSSHRRTHSHQSPCP